MGKHYRNLPVGPQELEDLARLAQAELTAFFNRNPHLVGLYQSRLLAAALCQGAALQAVGPGYGVQDFDVHFFYARNPARPRVSHSVKRIIANVGQFHVIPVDFIRTVVPPVAGTPSNPVAYLRQFLQQEPTPNAHHLAQKTVVGLLPATVFGVQLWPLPQASRQAPAGQPQPP
jgi:hypothetical protein